MYECHYCSRLKVRPALAVALGREGQYGERSARLTATVVGGSIVLYTGRPVGIYVKTTYYDIQTQCIPRRGTRREVTHEGAFVRGLCTQNQTDLRE